MDRLKIAQRLNEQRPAYLPRLNVCLQVNISLETSKSGISLAELPGLVEEVRLLPNLRLRGVMAIPEPVDNYHQQRQPYRLLYQAVQQLNKPELDSFSFGMSVGFEGRDYGGRDYGKDRLRTVRRTPIT